MEHVIDINGKQFKMIRITIFMLKNTLKEKYDTLLAEFSTVLGAPENLKKFEGRWNTFVRDMFGIKKWQRIPKELRLSNIPLEKVSEVIVNFFELLQEIPDAAEKQMASLTSLQTKVSNQK